MAASKDVSNNPEEVQVNNEVPANINLSKPPPPHESPQPCQMHQEKIKLQAIMPTDKERNDVDFIGTKSPSQPLSQPPLKRLKQTPSEPQLKLVPTQVEPIPPQLEPVSSNSHLKQPPEVELTRIKSSLQPSSHSKTKEVQLLSRNTETNKVQVVERTTNDNHKAPKQENSTP